jgi:hypothetical protein
LGFETLVLGFETLLLGFETLVLRSAAFCSGFCMQKVGGLNRSTQHFILEEKMECADGSEISSRIYCGREDGAMGSLAAG